MTDAARDQPDRRLRRAVIAGGSGFMGRRQQADLRADRVEVETIGRRGADATWGDTTRVARPLLELGSALIRTDTELVLKSRWVVPQRLIQAGYDFRCPDLGGGPAAVRARRRATLMG